MKKLNPKIFKLAAELIFETELDLRKNGYSCWTNGACCAINSACEHYKEKDFHLYLMFFGDVFRPEDYQSVYWMADHTMTLDAVMNRRIIALLLAAEIVKDE